MDKRIEKMRAIRIVKATIKSCRTTEHWDGARRFADNLYRQFEIPEVEVLLCSKPGNCMDVDDIVNLEHRQSIENLLLDKLTLIRKFNLNVVR